jgi:ribonuclease PH
MTGARKIVEVQATAEQHPFDEAQLKKMMDYAAGGIEALIAKQRTILSQLPLRQ